jgi:hypothetical protein
MKKPKLDVHRTVPKPSEMLKHDESQTTMDGVHLKSEPDYERLERQWVRDSWKERELFDTTVTENYAHTSVRGENIMAETKKAPKHERAGVLSVTIWENKGEKGNYNTFSIQRGYQKDGKWENTETMRGQDLLPLAELLRKAYANHVAVAKSAEGE